MSQEEQDDVEKTALYRREKTRKAYNCYRSKLNGWTRQLELLVKTWRCQ